MKRQSNNQSRILTKAFFPILSIIVLTVHIFSCNHTDSFINSDQKIVVEANVSKYFYQQLQGIYTVKNEMYISYHPFPDTSPIYSTKSLSENVNNRKTIWILRSNTPVKIYPPFGIPIIIYPNDSIHISYIHDYPVYSGNNTQSIELLNALMEAEEKLIKTRKKNAYNARTLEDFLNWNQHLNDELALKMPILEYYKAKIPAAEYEDYAASTISSIESDRIDAFEAFRDSVIKGYPGLSLLNVCHIWDSTQYSPSAQWLRSLPNYYGSIGYIYSFNKMELFRRFNFESNDSLASKETRTYLYYTKAKQQYKGLMRERLLAHILDEPTITELGLNNPIAQTLLKDYYSQPGYPEYKAWVKGLEKKKQERLKEKENKKKEKQES